MQSSLACFRVRFAFQNDWPKTLASKLTHDLDVRCNFSGFYVSCLSVCGVWVTFWVRQMSMVFLVVFTLELIIASLEKKSDLFD